VQLPVAGQVSSQLPLEQSATHGEVLQDAVQLPAEQLQFPPEQSVGWRDAPVPGSAIAGPPLGDPALVEEPLDPPHAAAKQMKKPKQVVNLSKMKPALSWQAFYTECIPTRDATSPILRQRATRALTLLTVPSGGPALSFLRPTSVRSRRRGKPVTDPS
jgi:hypothetical protein